MSVRRELQWMFAGIDRDVEAHFFTLASVELERLFRAYEISYGITAATYARKAYLKWRSGEVRMSGATAERLLRLLPPLLPLEARFELVRKLLAAKFRPMHRSIRTTLDRWREDLMPIVRDVVDHGASAVIPSALKERVAWLSGKDVMIVENLLLAASQNEAVQRVKFLEFELERVELMVQQRDEADTSITHVIVLPQGTVNVYIDIPRRPLGLRVKKWLGGWL